MGTNKNAINRGKRFSREVKGLSAFHRKQLSLGYLYSDVTVVWYENETIARIRLKANDRHSEEYTWIVLLDGTMPCKSKDELREITINIKKVISWCVRNYKRILISGDKPKEKVYAKQISLRSKLREKPFLTKLNTVSEKRLKYWWDSYMQTSRCPRVTQPHTAPSEDIPPTPLELLISKLSRMNPYLFEFCYSVDDIGDVSNLTRRDMDVIATIVKIVREVMSDRENLEESFDQILNLVHIRPIDVNVRNIMNQLLLKLKVEQPQPSNDSFIDTVDYVLNLESTTVDQTNPTIQIVMWYYEIARIVYAFENALIGQGKFTHSDDLKGDIQKLIDKLPMEEINQQLLNPPPQTQSYNHLRIYRLLNDILKTL